MTKRTKQILSVPIVALLLLSATIDCSFYTKENLTTKAEKSIKNNIKEDVKKFIKTEELVKVEPAQNFSSEISSSWEDMDIKIDGIVYHFPYDYEQFNENGWHVNLEKCGYENDYVLNKGDKVPPIIDMYNDKYGDDYDDFSMRVGFKNYSDEAANILECNLWKVELNSMYGHEAIKNCPEIEITKGIKWGATKEEIIGAFGKWDDIYENNEGKYIKVDYIDSYELYMTLTIHEEHGLTAIAFESYK